MEEQVRRKRPHHYSTRGRFQQDALEGIGRNGAWRFEGNGKRNLSAEERFRQNDFDLRIKSSWNVDREQLAFSGKIRTRHTRDEGFGTPLYEAGVAYVQDAFNNASVTFTIPKGTPSREIRLRSSTDIGNDFLQLSLAVTFRRTAETPLHPLHAAFFARFIF